MIGRTESVLQETAKLLPAEAQVEIFAASVTEESEMRKIAAQVGGWDILILDAAHLITASPTVNGKSSVQDWWQHYETNVKAVGIASQAFIPQTKADASLFTINSGAMAMPTAHTPTMSAYLSASAVHPGMVDRNILRSSGANPTQLPMDTGMLVTGSCWIPVDNLEVNLPTHFLSGLHRPRIGFSAAERSERTGMSRSLKILLEMYRTF